MDNKKQRKLEKILRLVSCSAILVSIFLFTSITNEAKIITQLPDSNDNISAKEFAYTFKVADKLTGNGAIKLSLDKNTIKGIANGIGMTCQCNIDFQTSIKGDVSKRDGISIEVAGIGDPIGIPIPGKVTFQGPLKATTDNGKLSLTGKVNIKGCLARYAGFKKQEDILIEIPDSSLAKAFRRIKNQGSLASL